MKTIEINETKNLLIGTKIWWRWKGEKSILTEYIIAKQNNLIELSSSPSGSWGRHWKAIDEIDILEFKIQPK